MKMSGTLIVASAAAPAVAWVTTLASGMTTPDTGTVLSGLSSLGFAGLVWYLIAIRDPKREELEAKEREQLAERFDRREIEYRAALEKVTESLGQRIDRNTETLTMINQSWSHYFNREHPASSGQSAVIYRPEPEG